MVGDHFFRQDPHGSYRPGPGWRDEDEIDFPFRLIRRVGQPGLRRLGRFPVITEQLTSVREPGRSLKSPISTIGWSTVRRNSRSSRAWVNRTRSSSTQSKWTIHHPQALAGRQLNFRHQSHPWLAAGRKWYLRNFANRIPGKNRHPVLPALEVHELPERGVQPQCPTEFRRLIHPATSPTMAIHLHQTDDVGWRLSRIAPRASATADRPCRHHAECCTTPP